MNMCNIWTWYRFQGYILGIIMDCKLSGTLMKSQRGFGEKSRIFWFGKTLGTLDIDWASRGMLNKQSFS